MVLGRTLKQYKHFIKNLVSQLIQYESINTTAAKVSNKLLRQNY